MKRLILITLCAAPPLLFGTSCSRGEVWKPVRIDASHGGLQGRFTPAAPDVMVVLCELASVRDRWYRGCLLRPALADITDENGAFSISMIPPANPGRLYRSATYVLTYAPADLSRVTLVDTIDFLPRDDDTPVQVKMVSQDGKHIVREDADLGPYILKKGSQLGTGTRPFFRKASVHHKRSGLSMMIAIDTMLNVTIEPNKISRIVISPPVPPR